MVAFPLIGSHAIECGLMYSCCPFVLRCCTYWADRSAPCSLSCMHVRLYVAECQWTLSSMQVPIFSTRNNVEESVKRSCAHGMARVVPFSQPPIKELASHAELTRPGRQHCTGRQCEVLCWQGKRCLVMALTCGYRMVEGTQHAMWLPSMGRPPSSTCARSDGGQTLTGELPLDCSPNHSNCAFCIL